MEHDLLDHFSRGDITITDDLSIREDTLDFCPICAASNRKEFEQLFRYGSYSMQKIADIVGCTKKQSRIHFETHCKTDFLARSPSDLLTDDDIHEMIATKKIMYRMILKLEDKVNEEFDTGELPIKDLKSMVGELRRYIKGLADIEKGLHEVPKRQINILYNNFNDLSSIVMRLACPACREKIITAIGEHESLEEFIPI